MSLRRRRRNVWLKAAIERGKQAQLSALVQQAIEAGRLPEKSPPRDDEAAWGAIFWEYGRILDKLREPELIKRGKRAWLADEKKRGKNPGKYQAYVDELHKQRPHATISMLVSSAAAHFKVSKRTVWKHAHQTW